MAGNKKFDFRESVARVVRSTMDQASALKEIAQAEMSARGVAEFSRPSQPSDGLLTQLGERVFELYSRGQLRGLQNLPHLAELLREIEASEKIAAEPVLEFSPEPPTAPPAHSPWPEDGADQALPVWRPGSDTQPYVTAKRRSEGASDARGRHRIERHGEDIAFVAEAPKPEDVDSDHDLADYMHEDDL